MKDGQEASARERASRGPGPACPGQHPDASHNPHAGREWLIDSLSGVRQGPNLRPCPCGPGLRGRPSEQLPRERKLKLLRPSRPLRLSPGGGKGARAAAGGRMVRPEAEASEEGEAFLRRYALAQSDDSGDKPSTTVLSRCLISHSFVPVSRMWVP